MKRLLCIMLALFMLLTAAGCKRDTNAGFTESEVAQIRAAQDAIQTGEIPQSWLHPEGTEIEFENILYKFNSARIVDELPENLRTDAILEKYEHFVVVNVTMKNLSSEQNEIVLGFRLVADSPNGAYDFAEYSAFEKNMFEAGTYEYSHYIFKPNEELTSDFLFVCHERNLRDSVIYATPSSYATSYAKILDVQYVSPERRKNPDLEIWETIYEEFSITEPESTTVKRWTLPAPEYGTLKKSDISCNENKRLTIIIKNMEYDYAVKYLNELIFYGYNSYYDDEKRDVINTFEPTVNEEAGTVELYVGFWYDFKYTKSTKELVISMI